MSHHPGFHANGEPIIHGRSAFGPVVATNPDPKFQPRQRAQDVQSTAPPSAQHPPTRPVAAARQMPPPSDATFAQWRQPRISQPSTLSTPFSLASAFPGNHRPAPFADAISGTAKTGIRWPASSPSNSIVRADQVAPPCADASDTWHNTSLGVMRYYPRRESYNTEVPITITFATTHGPGLVGVAMTELGRGRGVLEPDTPIGNFMLPGYQWAGPTGRLVFEWPGYPAGLTAPLDLQDATGRGRYVSRLTFGRQIACRVHEFIEKLGDPNQFTPTIPHARLGQHGIRFEQLRLLEVISFNGQDFYLQLGIAPVPPVTAYYDGKVTK